MEIEKIDVKKLKFLDETGTNLAMAREYARSMRGKRAVGSVPHQRGKQTTITGVLGITGILCCQAFEGAMNEGKMLYFIKHVLAKTWDREDILVMDNLTSHKTLFVLKTLEECKIKYIFLPPYHPELNPIELFWSAFKANLKALQARTQKDLLYCIAATFRMLRDIDAIKLFEKCGYEISKKLETRLQAA